MAPTGKENSIHGARVAAVTPLTMTGSRLRVAMSKGRAVIRMPSPILEAAAAVHRRQKSWESLVGGGATGGDYVSRLNAEVFLKKLDSIQSTLPVYE